MSDKFPIFGIFGRPSIGKSSIVATLTENDGVGISPWGGTTKEVMDYRLEANSQYALVCDTPGFARPREAFDWLKQRADGAHRRSDAIKLFVQNRDCQRQFPVETALLRLIMDRDAAILYVADDSRRFTPEYEAEMEILRWTGQARMGLINPFDERKYEEDWRLALRQYFDVVKVFNPTVADFEKKVQIFESFCQIKPGTRSGILELIDALRGQRSGRMDESLSILAGMLARICTHSESESAYSHEAAENLQRGLASQYRTAMELAEHNAHIQLLRTYKYRNLEYLIGNLPVPEGLFDINASLLSKVKQRLSILTSSDKPMFEASVGPIGADQCVGYVYPILHRFLFLFHLLQRRTHAVQKGLEISDFSKVEKFADDLTAKLTEKQKRHLRTDLNRLCQQKAVSRLPDSLKPLLATLAIQ